MCMWQEMRVMGVWFPTPPCGSPTPDQKDDGNLTEPIKKDFYLSFFFFFPSSKALLFLS